MFLFVFISYNTYVDNRTNSAAANMKVKPSNDEKAGEKYKTIQPVTHAVQKLVAAEKVKKTEAL